MPPCCGHKASTEFKYGDLNIVSDTTQIKALLTLSFNILLMFSPSQNAVVGAMSKLISFRQKVTTLLNMFDVGQGVTEALVIVAVFW